MIHNPAPANISLVGHWNDDDDFDSLTLSHLYAQGGGVLTSLKAKPKICFFYFWKLAAYIMIHN